MDANKNLARYKERKSDFESLLKRQKRLLLYISILRLFAAVLAVYFFVLGMKSTLQITWIISGLMLVLFFTLVSYHKNQNDKKKLLIELISLNNTELDCLDNNFKDNNPGDQFIESDHPWSYDLDLFGKGSFFQFINRTSTHSGPGYLADYLCTPISDVKDIISRQSQIKELKEKLDLRQFYVSNAKMMSVKGEDYDDVLRWSKQAAFIEAYPWTKIVAWIMSFISFGIIIAGIFFPGFFRLLIPVIIVNLALLSPFLTRTGRYQVQVSKKHSFLKTYSVLLDILAKEDFQHPELKIIKEKSQDASIAIKKLSSLLDLFDQRLNLLVGFVLNMFFLFDFFMLHRLAKWNKKHRDDLDQWLEVSGKFDALISLAGFAFNHPDYIYPSLTENKRGFIATELGHPMISSEKRVNNSIKITEEKVVLITGANMAGKSTFLRSLGINMALMYAGCPVCAHEFETDAYLLYSSMRTSDSLKDDESYFYAEIKRLKKIVDLMKEGKKMMILLDEVLKGTNTTDKQRGSRGLIEKSINHNVLCFIATHDLSLGKLQEEHKGSVVNYCFESDIKDLQLTFDYKIRNGLAKNMNASFLMKQMGIMD